MSTGDIGRGLDFVGEHESTVSRSSFFRTSSPYFQKHPSGFDLPHGLSFYAFVRDLKKRRSADLPMNMPWSAKASLTSERGVVLHRQTGQFFPRRLIEVVNFTEGHDLDKIIHALRVCYTFD
ncbi:hypothetical protein [Agrobacterium vaccinii]|uniref:hypothetical protein n=1 Tax=Agrobacterium vaccinii TaxID=2735528 RepID=UPI001E4294B2|nr:hypothetical protein [Agrobacterium vaccinii]UHS59555.1 hypothetical protein HRS00_22365 [Agrobacterium vaccinii]